MNTIKKINTLLFLFITLISFSQNIITDRPDQIKDSSTVSFKSLQIEMGILLLRSNGIQSNAYPSVLWRYGVSEKFEVRLLTQFETNKTLNSSLKNGGISDLQIGAKIQLFKKENVNTEIAFLSHLIIPTAKREITNDKLGTINKLSISHSVSEKVSVGYNVGYDYFEKEKGNLTYSLSFGFSLSEKLNFYLESFGGFNEFKKHLASFDTGFTYLSTNNLQFDISYGTGLNYGMTYFSTGFSWNMKRN
tara:strand:+ start:4741 stop:5484 length:744 start_codon:yes stop_codon:yes gene_type:complete